MYKLYLLMPLVFSACSHFTFNATMCDQIATDPNAMVSEECRIYNEEEAQKSFDNTQNKKMQSDEAIEFSKDK